MSFLFTRHVLSHLHVKLMYVLKTILNVWKCICIGFTKNYKRIHVQYFKLRSAIKNVLLKVH